MCGKRKCCDDAKQSSAKRTRLNGTPYGLKRKAEWGCGFVEPPAKRPRLESQTTVLKHNDGNNNILRALGIYKETPTITLDELNNAKLLCAVHTWDLLNGDAKRNWSWITKRAGIPTSPFWIEKRFRKLRQATEFWWPYPLTPLSNYAPELPYVPIMDPDFLYYIYGKDLLDFQVENIKNCMITLEPWAMHTPQVQHFLGYHEKPVGLEEDLDVYYERYLEAVRLLPREVLLKYEKYQRGEEDYKTWWDICWEMEKLIDMFNGTSRSIVCDIKPDEQVAKISDIAYYRRKILREDEQPCRQMMSDFEMMKLYMCSIRDGFYLETTSIEWWRNYLDEIGIRGLDAQEARHDMLKYCIPRLRHLRYYLAPGMDSFVYQMQNSVQRCYAVIYHSSSDRTFKGALRIICWLVKSGTIGLKNISTGGYHHAAFKYMIYVMKATYTDFETSLDEFTSSRASYVLDILSKYAYFKHGEKMY